MNQYPDYAAITEWNEPPSVNSVLVETWRVLHNVGGGVPGFGKAWYNLHRAMVGHNLLKIELANTGVARR